MFLTKEKYFNLANELNDGIHWSTMEPRWRYHSAAVDVLKENGIDKNSKVLEIGTMGIKIFENSTTMNYIEKWDFPGKSPDIVHDIRNIPWPVKNKAYDWAIALRVLQHVPGKQEECFNEMKRIAKNILIVVPPKYKLHNGKGITTEDFIKYNNGSKPNIVKKIGKYGPVYAWLNI